MASLKSCHPNCHLPDKGPDAERSSYFAVRDWHLPKYALHASLYGGFPSYKPVWFQSCVCKYREAALVYELH